ncbi:isocitrate lyase/phosphoenolpyruvate mutase family protein [Zoogloea sp.]|uniref:isocitrate lyase/phosphoenolpyruvate mutase family protein n=1 Tax=Zoogloea sp. TaxID=49181 RepID=UPI001ACF9DF0|nr:isocitrate lyase/phosphoenolpyruvate mutase family protein [Zoogloea sp.]MBN8284670.1 isocitrate lyase/phosphoenolpyruvate mutase family protein [Zoogloea sp.]
MTDNELSIARYRGKAASYDASAERTMALRRRTIALLQLVPGQTVLDVGAGTGLSYALLRDGVRETGRVLAFEQSPDMFALAHRRVQREGWRNVWHTNEPAETVRLPHTADAVLFNYTHDICRTPEAVANTLRLAATTGIVGGSIEDGSGDRAAPLYPLALATERIRAAVEAARDLPFPFTLTARAENYFIGQPDLADTIRRLQAYQEAGADVLFAPGLRTREDIAAVVSSVDRPVNVLMGMEGVTLTVADLEALGVKRISVGGSFARAAYGAFLRAAKEVQDKGSFGYADEAISGRDITRLLRKPPG